MGKTLKFLFMALVAIVFTLGFAACSSDDDDSAKQIYTKGFSVTEIHGTGLGAIDNVIGQIQKPFDAAFGSASTFEYDSDSKVKSTCEKAASSITVNWGDSYGKLVYEVTNVKSNKVVFSKTFEKSK